MDHAVGCLRRLTDRLEVVEVAAADGRAPSTASLTDLVVASLDAGGGMLQAHRDRDAASVRYEIISANEQLQERELLKLAKLSQAMTAALVARGVADVPARLAGDLIVSVFNAAFARWIAPGEDRDLVEIQREGLAAISDLTRAVTPSRP